MPRSSRHEQLEKAAAATQEKIAALKQQQSTIQKQQRFEQQRLLHQRHVLVGQMADGVGLLAWDDVTLQAMLHTLARLLTVPDPVRTLEGVLADTCGSPGTSLDGCAHRGDGVPAAPSV